MARFTHPTMVSAGATSAGSWTISGGTISDPQPTFSSDPLFSGNWTRIDGLCTFAIEVDMSNITGFGDSQYFLELPFESDDDLVFAGGHLHDTSGDDYYSILGHVEKYSHVMTLWSIASNGRQVPFEYGVPVALAGEGSGHPDHFTIAGHFHIKPGSPFYG